VAQREHFGTGCWPTTSRITADTAAATAATTTSSTANWLEGRSVGLSKTGKITPLARGNWGYSDALIDAAASKLRDPLLGALPVRAIAEEALWPFSTPLLLLLLRA